MDTKEYIEKDKVLLFIDDAMYKAKSYDGGLNEETSLRIFNSLKLVIKTMGTIKVNKKGEIIND
jgi:hypothetical protein